MTVWRPLPRALLLVNGSTHSEVRTYHQTIALEMSMPVSRSSNVYVPASLHGKVVHGAAHPSAGAC